MFLGEYIEAERERMRYTRGALAELVGYRSASSIYEIERMGQEVPRDKLVAILRALELPELSWPTAMALDVGRVAVAREPQGAQESER